jgi:bacillithiol biosynthesis cysteine-adding enzyme BshC
LGKQFPRKSLVDRLSRYNQELGNDDSALNNLKHLLQENTFCVVTGQQLGFMGGPSYTILKAITCLLVAREAGAVPIFWLATEDHDVGEIDHTFLLDQLGNLKEFHLPLPKNGVPAEDLELTSKGLSVIKDFENELGNPELLVNVVKERSYAKAMAKVLCQLFKGTGLIFLEPRLLRTLAVPFFQKEISRAAEINEVLTNNLTKLQAADPSASWVPVEATNLFYKGQEGRRKKIRYQEGKYTIGQTLFSPSELLALVERSPENFSPNVLSRPILQSAFLPVIGYIAGPNEMHYYRQLKEYYRLHNAIMPWILPRISATLLPRQAEDWLERCNKQPWDHLPVHWDQMMPDINSGLSEVIQEWQQAAEANFINDLPHELIERLIRQSAKKLQKRVVKSRLKKLNLPYYALHYLNNLLYPRQQMQERVLNWWGFQAQCSENLVQASLNTLDWRAEGHYYLYL